MAFTDELSSLGQVAGDPITVRLSNEVVTLLSSQLYQSPLKAIEELVVNSYDADASECRLLVPSSNDGFQTVLVYDDGHGMDAKGLSALWLVARSNKRDEAYQRRMKRKQIGKFGIGKLATYAIADNITYISRVEGDILAVSANFDQFKEGEHGLAPIKLPVTRVTPWEKLKESRVFRSACEHAGVAIDPLFGTEHQSWTIALLEQLKPPSVQLGRLRWVLRTAMPLRSDFQLFLNEEQIKSSKEESGVIVEFNVVDLPPERLDSVNRKTHENWHAQSDGLFSASFPEGVMGSVIVTEKSLHVGKSGDLGRSHGFFVKVRGRLINEEDPLFGLFPLSYATFNRFRADITVDDLDKAVTAPREGISKSPVQDKILPLLAEIFYEARARYDIYNDEQERKNKALREHERTYVPVRLVEHPIADVLSLPSTAPQEGSEADESWFYLNVGTEQTSDIVRQLYAQTRERKYRFSCTSRGKSARLVQFMPEDSTFYLNADHDLVLAYYEDPRSQSLLEDIATAEVALEVYLREHGMAAHVVGDVLERRDSLLRGLANEHLFSASAIGKSLIDSASDERDLEVALVAAARALGFVATHKSGSKQPDGIGRFTDYPTGEKKITLEAKSSQDTPSLSHIDFAGLKEHVTRHQASGCLLLAPAYPGPSLGDESAVSRRARENRVSCWTVEQLARVVSAAEDRHISARQVLDIVLYKFAPTDVTVAVEKLLSDPTWEHRSLYVAILKSLRGLEGRLEDQPRTVAHIATEVTRLPEFVDVPQVAIRDAIADLAGASQGAMVFNNNRLILNVSIEEIERRLSGLTRGESAPRRGGTFRQSL